MIILEILKIIGIVLGGIVGLVIVLLLIICLVPIRYKLSGKGENTEIEGCAKATWLFSFLNAGVAYKDKNFFYYVSIAGKKLIKESFGQEEGEALNEVLHEEGIIPSSGESAESNASQEPAVSESEEVSVSEEADSESNASQESVPSETEAASTAEEVSTETAVCEKIQTEELIARSENGVQSEELKSFEEASVREETDEQKQQVEEKAEQDAEREEQESEKAEQSAEREAVKEEIRAEREALKETWEESEEKSPFKEKIKSRIESVKKILEKIKSIKRIIEAKTTKRAWRHLKKEAFRIHNHLKPRVISGNICFGLDDPANTAMLYGTVVTYAKYISDGKLIINPEFYEKEIKFDLLIKGRFFTGYVLLCLLRLYLDQDIHRVIKAVRRFLNG
ncbi:MAG: hypothetical protein IKF90_02920 [Parasporobacterium sp.]|nr:hypothetical protein [Parasporobacterium sp.]